MIYSKNLKVASRGEGKESRGAVERADEIHKLWRDYKKSKSLELRNRLIENYLPYVRYLTERICVKLPNTIDVNDMLSAGIFGLMDAVDVFDPERGVKFETYCITRIRGSIIDELRNMDWVPRLVRSRAHKLEQAMQTLERKLGRAPSEEEVADFLGISTAECEEMIKSASAYTIFSYGKATSPNDENDEIRRVESQESKKRVDPLDELYRKELMELVTRGISKKEQLILVLYYFDELTMKEIGAILDISESRVCQIHSSLLLRLRSQLLRQRNELLS